MELTANYSCKSGNLERFGFPSVCSHPNKNGISRRRSVVGFSRQFCSGFLLLFFCQINIFLFYVTICDLVHDMDALQTAKSVWKSYLTNK